jgi:predicted MPP superfamily phosphohydrolase
MWMSCKILILLWAINFAPPFLAYLFEDKWNAPLDRDYRWKDGNPLFGPHKTLRGVLGSMAAGMVFGGLLGFPWWLGLCCALLSMAGDLVSSFLKRRRGLHSGSIVPGLDQIFEGLLPFLILVPYFSLTSSQIVLLAVFFCMGAYAGSLFFKTILSMKPFDDYPRLVRSRVRLREWRHCELKSSPLCYLLNFERAVFYHCILKNVFRLFGVYEKGQANALAIEQKELELFFTDLPPGFDGYKVLFLTDLHLDGLPGLTEKLQNLVKDLQVDLCILGGDFRMETYGPFTKALELLNRIIPTIRARDGIIGILGNHDCPEIITPLRRSGVEFLVNESMSVSRNGEKIWVLGVDDPHLYKCHDLKEAFEDVPEGVFTVLAAHSPEIYREASEFGARLYLCGHTHAGQIQIPTFGPLLTHCKCPRRYSEGAWQYGKMLGYTTPGVGASGVPVRFFSKGEVTLITLRRGSEENPSQN